MTNAFKIVVLGCSGGPKEDNLSGYLISPFEKDDYLALDAGALLNGIDKALEKGNLKNIDLEDPKLTPLGVFFRKYVKGYLISHPHLDHTLGLVINSQADSPKFVGGANFTIKALKKHFFNGCSWPNFTNEGKKPINLYKYLHLKFLKKTPLPESDLFVQAFKLKHDECCDSTAFLIEHKGEFVLYFGDTASDSNAKGHHLAFIWKKISPLIEKRKLRGIFLECSYFAGEGGQGALYHLDTKTFMEELKALETISGQSLKGLSCIVTHRKEGFYKKSSSQKIEEELIKNNRMGLNLIFPKQGDLIVL